MTQKNSLDEIRAALADTTPGEWEWDRMDPLSNPKRLLSAMEYDEDSMRAHLIFFIDDSYPPRAEDAEWIEKSRGYVTYLLSEIEELQESVEALGRQLKGKE